MYKLINCIFGMCLMFLTKNISYNTHDTPQSLFTTWETFKRKRENIDKSWIQLMFLSLQLISLIAAMRQGRWLSFTLISGREFMLNDLLRAFLHFYQHSKWVPWPWQVCSKFGLWNRSSVQLKSFFVVILWLRLSLVLQASQVFLSPLIGQLLQEVLVMMQPSS